MQIADLQPWEHYRSASAIYLIVDITLTHVVLMKVQNYLPGEKRKFKPYLHADFIRMVEKQALTSYVPTLPAPAPAKKK
jgi:hypothetical protein